MSLSSLRSREKRDLWKECREAESSFGRCPRSGSGRYFLLCPNESNLLRTKSNRVERLSSLSHRSEDLKPKCECGCEEIIAPYQFIQRLSDADLVLASKIVPFSEDACHTSRNWFQPSECFDKEEAESWREHFRDVVLDDLLPGLFNLMLLAKFPKVIVGLIRAYDCCGNAHEWCRENEVK